MMAADIPSFKLNNGKLIPAVGMGCWQGQPGLGVDNALIAGLSESFKCGYRHLDTATVYQNEREVGESIRSSGIPRDQIFVTTKLSPKDRHDVRSAFDRSIESLGLDYIDLYLMHWPQGLDSEGKAYNGGPRGPDFNEVWAEMEALLETGKCHSIGVSNFSPANLNKLLETAKVVPAVNQIEAHPYLPDQELVDLCAKHGIHVTAYSPLGQANSPILKDADLEAIAEAHGCTVGQVALSWAVQRGTSVVPKSTNPKRMKENITLVKLSQAEMEKINKISELDPSRHTRLNVVTVKAGKVVGWTLEQLGWDVGFNTEKVKLLPRSSKSKVSDTLRDFITKFYRVSDTPQVHQEYVDLFTSSEPVRFQIGPMTPSTSLSGILEWRKAAWEAARDRQHTVLGIYPKEGGSDEIMIHGEVKMVQNADGSLFHRAWVGRMVFEKGSMDTDPKITEYKVWL
ncbi:hypothetical protein IE53DRAFT_384595 [Violaceomyces palustris]|uniref:Uncharacterized protein n=1 Tax=Violaceomyces palustris TaxID=1673888 RepID=A0ACD0P4A1_9BASI|nr:hypothetical protein IE53DRAFT_384595 [Violaceomyces palustris]